jgi:hypothetical protein
LTLEEALDEIQKLHGDEVIFARKPWRMESDALIGLFDIAADGEYRVPTGLLENGFEYVLEGHVAKEVLDNRIGREATPQKRRELLLYYATHDAYPDWAEER